MAPEQAPALDPTRLVPPPEATDDEIRTALIDADIPVLLMVLVHLTDDTRWIEAPFLPVRDMTFFADESGGLPADVQAEVRQAALDALVALRDGRLEVPPVPGAELLADMMSVCVGMRVPDEYVPMMLEEMALVDRDVHLDDPPVEAAQGLHVLIVGAGISGLLLGSKLEREGIPYTIVEKNPHLGGTWWENTYPDVRCDVPNHFYSYSFRPNLDWTGYFSRGAEIQSYIEQCADEFGVVPRIRLGTEVVSVAYDEAARTWTAELRLADGSTDTLTASVVISAVGQLNRPKLPDIEGRDTFGGPAFHTAQWRHDVDLKGKRVAVIGTGASAMQLVPPVAQEAGRLFVFQRSAQWAIPTRDYHRQVTAEKRWLLHHVPYYASWYRFTLAWRFGDHLLPTVRVDPEWPHPERSVSAKNDKHREFLTEYIKEELGDRQDLLPKVLPDYPPYGKRILVDNHWFRTITRDDVELVTDHIERITPAGVRLVTGEEIPVDVIVYATGFQTSKLVWPMEVRGRGGRTLAEEWGDDDARAYLGITVPGFPNLFCMYGPNTNLGHGGSIIFVAECQARYVMGCIERMVEDGIAALECRAEAYEDYVRRVDEAHAKMIWTHRGMDTWYRNRHGRVVSISPWRLVDYWRMTHEPDLGDYVVERG